MWGGPDKEPRARAKDHNVIMRRKGLLVYLLESDPAPLQVHADARGEQLTPETILGLKRALRTNRF